MNSSITYYNHITLPWERRAKRIGVLAGAIASVLIALWAVSYQINQFHIKELGGQSRYHQIAAFDNGATNANPQAAVKGLATGVVQESSLGYIDYRAYVLDEYFKYYNSPLYGTGELFVKSCDRYGALADCTTVAAIAHAETDLCKYHNSAEYYNCWGFGGGGPDRMYFNSWAESIDLVTSRLVYAYGLEYMRNPSLMEETFCGQEPGCTNWGTRVKYFIHNISEFPKRQGIGPSLFSFR